MKNLLLLLIRMYQKKPKLYFLPGSDSCRFSPSCSEYAYQSIREYGTIKGFFLAVGRILRCNPFSKGGYDPVKQSQSSNVKSQK